MDGLFWRTFALAALIAMPVHAQVATAPLPQLRADVIAGARPAAQVGAGMYAPLGVYVRAGIDVAIGSRLDTPANGASRLDGRVDLLGRFLLDPFRQSPWGFSAGAGLSLRAESGDRVRPYLLVALDLEGRRSTHGIAPAVQVGLGGGARIGVILRRVAAANR